MAAGAEFVMENGGGFVYLRDCESIAFIGPFKVDSDPLVYAQGKLVSYDAQSGVSTIEIMPGHVADRTPISHAASPERRGTSAAPAA